MDFILSKILWMFVAPDNFLVLLMLAGAFLSLSHRDGWRETGRRVCFDVAFLMFFIAIFPVGDWMLLPLENRFPPARPDHVDGIIVIGGDENPRISEARQQPAVRASASYFANFAALAREYPHAKLVYAGGEGRFAVASELTEAAVAKQAMTAMGVPVERVVFEDKSRNTRENAVLSAALVRPAPAQKWLLVTSAYHMPRSIGSFRKAGWNVYPAPADYRTDGRLSSELHFNLVDHLSGMTTAAHEYYGLFAYWLFGYIDSPWPK